MSAGCLRCAASDFAETVSFTYGVVLDDVRWQIDFLAAVPARAVVSAVPASARTTINKASRFMFLPPNLRSLPLQLLRRRRTSGFEGPWAGGSRRRTLLRCARHPSGGCC